LAFPLRSIVAMDEDFEWMTADDVPSTVDPEFWAINFTPSADLYAKIIAGKRVKIYDNDVPNAVDITKRLKCPRSHYLPAPYNEINIQVKPVTATSAACYSHINLIKDNGSTVWMYFRISHTTGGIEYSADGITYSAITVLTLDADQVISIIITSATSASFYVGSEFKGTFSVATGYTSYINKVQFKTTSDSTTPAPVALVDETFEEDVAGPHYIDGENPDGTSHHYIAWEVYAEGAAAHFTVEHETLGGVESHWGYFYQLTANDKYLRVAGEFDTPSPSKPDASHTDYKIAFDIYITSTRFCSAFAESDNDTWETTCKVGLYGDIDNNKWTTRIFGGDGDDIQIGGSNVACAVNTLYHVVVWFSSADKSKYSFDGGSTWSGEYTNRGLVAAWAIPVKTMWLYGAGSWTQQFYMDNIDASWTISQPPDVAIPVHLEIDDICNDGTVNVRDAAPDILAPGSLVHLHACPTTRGGVDYQVDGDFPIRAIKWRHDEGALVDLGFAEARVQSPEEWLDGILTRHDHALTG
jgi:hypothetical protein